MKWSELAQKPPSAMICVVFAGLEQIVMVFEWNSFWKTDRRSSSITASRNENDEICKYFTEFDA